MGESDMQDPRSTAIGELPLTGEPLPLDLVNTVFIKGGVRGRMIDALAGPPDLDAWLAAQRVRFPAPVAGEMLRAGPADASLFEDFLEVRRSLRALAGVCTAGGTAPPDDLAVLNTWARRAASWQELVQEEGLVTAVGRRSEDDPRRAALAQIAAEAVALFAGAGAELLRACPAPGCVLYFVKSHTRREWCTVGCGNRVRVARHSRRGRDAGR
ncbi:ABATE domain-containing protein [Streptomyces sp. NBC_01218]|uniref:CGNR zinc finger domain-containing protein n=1 Tax=unclassified Streptomyces TaxID=2593676 RepID=UPI002E11518C|nr:ABATE domain-containing protein [Streptomyces sp. NBC_01218]